MKTELSNHEQLLQAQDELIKFLDRQRLRLLFTGEEFAKWINLTSDVSRLRQAVEFDLLCDPDIYEASANEHFENGYKEELYSAINEIKDLQERLKDAEDEIRQLNNELRNR